MYSYVHTNNPDVRNLGPRTQTCDSTVLNFDDKTIKTKNREISYNS